MALMTRGFLLLPMHSTVFHCFFQVNSTRPSTSTDSAEPVTIKAQVIMGGSPAAVPVAVPLAQPFISRQSTRIHTTTFRVTLLFGFS